MSSEIDVVVQLLKASQEAANPDPTIEEQRAGMEAMSENMPTAEGVTISETELDGVAGLKLTPADAKPGRALLYFHGGGYVLGSPATHRGLVSQVAAAMQAEAWSMDYRLAPEAPFPAAIEDGVAAYRGLLDSGIAPESIIISGDSAGGGTTVATALKARDDGLPMPAGLIPLSPWVNLENTGWSYGEKAELDPMITKQSIDKMAETYLNGGDAKQPYASPVHADLAGLPPMLIQVGPNEVLLSDSITLAERAGAAHVPVTLEIWPRMIHVFQAFYPFLSDARAAIARMGAWAETRWGG
ncbi:MAG: alpha/beta hydrolase [Pseudomonadota bacterium]